MCIFNQGVKGDNQVDIYRRTYVESESQWSIANRLGEDINEQSGLRRDLALDEQWICGHIQNTEMKMEQQAILRMMCLNCISPVQ